MIKILAIETSCDETACAIVNEKKDILASVVTSQIDIHARFGGVIPEVASRMHVEQISIIIKKALSDANLSMNDIDYIAYTIGPGLIGSLLIGSLAAKTLAFFYQKPLIAVNHLKGHIFVDELLTELQYPLIAAIISGGHTEIVYVTNDHDFKIIGTTLDDAIGESYDKVARLISLAYPGGPKIDKLAKTGKKHYVLPSPKVAGYNMSFSGLKNACLQLTKKEEVKGKKINEADLAYAFQEKALGHLINKIKLAVNDYKPKMLIFGGGVAANSRLREIVAEEFRELPHIIPPLKYCTDNATMIGIAALHNLENGYFASYNSACDSSLSIEEKEF